MLDNAHDPSRFAELHFGDLPEVYLDHFQFDTVTLGENVLKCRALGSGVAGAKVRGVWRSGDGAATGPAREISLATQAEAEVPFTVTASGRSKLELELVKGNRSLAKYTLQVNVYEAHLLVLVTGGSEVLQGRKNVDLRFDLRMKEEILPGYKIDVELRQGDRVLRRSHIDKIPGNFLRGRAGRRFAIGPLHN